MAESVSPRAGSEVRAGWRTAPQCPAAQAWRWGEPKSAPIGESPQFPPRPTSSPPRLAPPAPPPSAPALAASPHPRPSPPVPASSLPPGPASLAAPRVQRPPSPSVRGPRPHLLPGAVPAPPHLLAALPTAWRTLGRAGSEPPLTQPQVRGHRWTQAFPGRGSSGDVPPPPPGRCITSFEFLKSPHLVWKLDCLIFST